MDILRKKVNRRRDGIYREIPILTEEEAKEQGVEYVGWRKAVPDTKQVLTDDGYVVPVVSLKKYGKRWYLQTEIGPIFIDGYSKLFWKERKESGDYWHLKPWNKGWIEKEIQTQRFKRAVALYAKQLFDKKVDLHAVGMTWRKDSTKPAVAWKRMLKKKEVQKAVLEEIEKLYEEAGITKQTVVALEKEAIDMARSTNDGGLILKIAQTLSKRLGMDNETKLITTDVIQMEQLNEDIRNQINEKKKVKLQRATEEIIHPKSKVLEDVRDIEGGDEIQESEHSEGSRAE